MIANPRFVFIHLHKSGGTFVNECVLKFLADAEEVHYHYPRHLIPEKYAKLPILGMVRNPWDYYVSWYSFQLTVPHNPIYQVLSEGATLGFEGTIRNMLDLGATGKHLDRVIAALPPKYTGGGLNVPQSAMAPIRGSGRGFYTHLYHHMYDDAQGKSDD